MPSKKSKGGKKRGEEGEEDEVLQNVDVKYNPDIVSSLLSDLHIHTEAKCQSLLKDTEFQITSMQQAFHFELIKLPNNVKQMTMKQFREEFNFSADAVTRSVFQVPHIMKDGKATNYSAFETPSRKGPMNSVLQTPSTAMRNPREGEVILSTNGSPLGEFSTVKKAPRADKGLIIPPTPGVFLPLNNGDIVDIDHLDVENMPLEDKHETLEKMQNMMQNMRVMMERLQATANM